MNNQTTSFVNRTLYAQHRYLLHILDDNKDYITRALLNDDLCKDGFTELHDYLDELRVAISDITDDFVVKAEQDATN
jgi:hypothetical protein